MPKILPAVLTADEENQYTSREAGPNENELTRQTRLALPITLPWGREPIRLGTPFQSKMQSTSNPWSDQMPFVLSDMHMIPKDLRAEFGTTSTFKKVKTSKEYETGDHLSLGFGIEVSAPIPFLASASVKGTYDNHIRENTDSDKISIQANCRAGTIEFARQPRLTTEAKVELKHGGGFEGFIETYGDYYLSGYRLGGDTGILMSGYGHSRQEIDKYGITAEVTVLFVSGSKHWEKEFQQFRSGRNVRLLGFDTIDNMNWKRASAAGDDVKEIADWAKNSPEADADLLRADMDAIMTRSENLLERVAEVLERHGYENGASLTFTQCEELIREGIVVELILQPMSRLRDVMIWKYNDNVI